MALKRLAKELIRIAAPPFVRFMPLRTWPGWLGRTLDVKAPNSVIPKQEVSPAGQVNINVLFEMIERTRDLPGEIADAGVFRGASTAAMALYLKQNAIRKTIYGFDSFEGFPEEADADRSLGGAENEDRMTHGFSGTSLELVRRKLKRLNLRNVVLVPGFFDKAFAELKSSDLRFCFVHLDVNLYDSYKQCLDFFYPRLVSGGIVLFDEYNDPPWPGCNKAVDEFLLGKQETLELIERNYYQKWFFVKCSAAEQLSMDADLRVPTSAA